MKIAAFSKTYEDRCVLDFPGLELQPGKIYAIIGANGSGKSTFAKILAGILPADKREAALGVLSHDPRPSYQRKPDRIYGLTFAGYDIRFRVQEDVLTVLNVEKVC